MVRLALNTYTGPIRKEALLQDLVLIHLPDTAVLTRLLIDLQPLVKVHDG